jgi:2-polyprenyl-3-methyl-5-hydroxy-6-metoxy-1,4-benzoquinol methylase
MHASRNDEWLGVGEPGRDAPCILCGGERFAPHFKIRREVPPAAPPAGGYRITHSERRLVGEIVRCTGCGMVFLPSRFVRTEAYADAEDPVYIEHPEQRIANSHALLDLLPSGGRLLEIGCACGFLLVAARERGFSVEGVEVSRWSSEYARREYGLAVTTGTVATACLPESHYDVVVMADVIEHLADPPEALREARRLLRPAGRLLLLTPDVGSLTARLAGRHWWGLLDDHYFYFSRDTLGRLLTREGFEVERLKALGRRFALEHWVMKVSQYHDGAHRILRGIVEVLGIGHLAVSLNLGDQLACVARRK